MILNWAAQTLWRCGTSCGKEIHSFGTSAEKALGRALKQDSYYSVAVMLKNYKHGYATKTVQEKKSN